MKGGAGGAKGGSAAKRGRFAAKEGAVGASSAAKEGAGGGAGTKGARQVQDIRQSNGGHEAIQGDAWPCQRVYFRGQIPRPILCPNEVHT